MSKFKPNAEPMQLNPLRAVRAKCLDCCGGSSSEVSQCKITGCSLWPYRNGRRPKEEIRRGKLTDWLSEHGYA